MAKQVYWEIIIEGMPDMKAFEQSVIDSVMKEFGNNVDDITKSLYQVRLHM